MKIFLKGFQSFEKLHQLVNVWFNHSLESKHTFINLELHVIQLPQKQFIIMKLVHPQPDINFAQFLHINLYTDFFHITRWNFYSSWANNPLYTILKCKFAYLKSWVINKISLVPSPSRSVIIGEGRRSSSVGYSLQNQVKIHHHICILHSVICQLDTKCHHK